MVQNYSFPTKDFLLLGKVAKAHGMRGEVKIFPYSGQPENIKAYRELVLVDSEGIMSPPLTVLSCRIQGKLAITALASVTNRDKAEHIKGMGVLLARKCLPELVENEFYWHQYVGKTVRNLEGKTIGEIKTVFNNGAQDVMAINAVTGEILVPISRDTVVREDNEGIIIDPPPGLLEIYTDDGNRRDG